MKNLIVFLIFLWIPLAQAQDCTLDQRVKLKDIINCAEQGDRVAQFMLGEIYNIGKEVPRNYKKAFEWYSKAAEQGDKNSQFCLYAAYYNGQGVPKNYVLAYMWLSLHIVNSSPAPFIPYPYTYECLDDLEKKLSPNELAKAQDMANDWLTKHKNNN